MAQYDTPMLLSRAYQNTWINELALGISKSKVLVSQDRPWDEDIGYLIEALPSMATDVWMFYGSMDTWI